MRKTRRQRGTDDPPEAYAGDAGLDEPAVTKGRVRFRCFWHELWTTVAVSFNLLVFCHADPLVLSSTRDEWFASTKNYRFVLSASVAGDFLTTRVLIIVPLRHELPFPVPR